MIYVYHADAALQIEMGLVTNERELVGLVMANLEQYQLATRVKHSELDIVFAATGGPTAWVNVDNMSVDYAPSLSRPSAYGDILVETCNGYVNLSTPAGFIPLIDVVEYNGQLNKKQFN